MHYDCVVVGAGHAGGCLAAALRQQRFSGSIALVGEEPFPPYERPPLSKAILTGEAQPESAYLHPTSSYAEQAIDLYLGSQVLGLDRHARCVTLADGRRMQYERLVLATGGRARALRIAGTGLPGVQTLRNLTEALQLKPHLIPGARIVVVGGGFIGLEVAAAARQRGAQVTVLESDRTLLRRSAPASIAAAVLRLHEFNGVEVRLDAQASGIVGATRVERVTTAHGDELEADLVVIGVGMTANIELAAAAGLTVADGILVNEFGETSAPGIYAIGDAARFYHPLFGRHVRLECWQNARDQAAAVAGVICGARQPYVEVPWLWSDQYAANLQFAGIATAGALEVIRGEPESAAFSVFGLHERRVIYVASLNAGRDVAAGKRLIARACAVDPTSLADPATDLRRLLS